MSRLTIAAVSVCLLGGSAYGQGAPTIVNHIREHLSDFTPIADGQAIPDSQATVTVPAGKALFIWSIAADRGPFGDNVGVMPKIGDQTGGRLDYRWPSGQGTAAGSWTVDCPGGELDVSLQSFNLGTNFPDSLSWTLIVFPDTPVPALGNIGLGILIATLVVSGGWVISRRTGFTRAA